MIFNNILSLCFISTVKKEPKIERFPALLKHLFAPHNVVISHSHNRRDGRAATGRSLIAAMSKGTASAACGIQQAKGLQLDVLVPLVVQGEHGIQSVIHVCKAFGISWDGIPNLIAE